MKITSYGLFWRRDEIEWFPGKGKRNEFRLLGKIGEQKRTLKIADFRNQQGIYILYDEYGPGYVGLTRKRGLGLRLKDHHEDDLAACWDRFSWFGFRDLGKAGPDGVLQLEPTVEEVSERTHTTIGDLEALLIRAIGPKRNSSSMNFSGAQKWLQLPYDDIKSYLAKLTPMAGG